MDISFLLNYAIEAALTGLLTVASVAIGLLASKARKYLGEANTKALQEKLETAAQAGIGYAESQLRDIAANYSKVELKSMWLKLALRYVLPRFKETFEEIKWTDEQIKEFLESRLYHSLPWLAATEGLDTAPNGGKAKTKTVAKP